MAVVKLAAAMNMALLLLLASTAAAAALSSPAGGDLASKLGMRRLLQDDNCIPPMEVCCSNCGWFENTNCCDPNTACSYNPFMDPSHAQDWCMPRNWDDLPKYAPWLFP